MKVSQSQIKISLGLPTKPWVSTGGEQPLLHYQHGGMSTLFYIKLFKKRNKWTLTNKNVIGYF